MTEPNCPLAWLNIVDMLLLFLLIFYKNICHEIYCYKYLGFMLILIVYSHTL